jgi:hypothetical protein
VHTIHAARDLTAPRATVYDFLSVHENWSLVFRPLRFEHESDGQDSPTGVGSTRKLSVRGLLPFYERIEVADPNERIEYMIIKGSPMRNHRGIAVLSDTPSGGAHIDYTISFDALPGLGAVLEAGLGRGLRQGLDRLEAATKP